MDLKELELLLTKMYREDLSQREQGLLPSERWRSVGWETAKFLHLLTAINRPENIVEIGTSQGVSAIVMGLTARTYGGNLTTYEVEDWRHKAAVKNISKLGLQNTVLPVLANILDESTDIPESIDFVFIDAEKGDYLNYLRRLEPSFHDKTLIVADNTVSHKQDLQNYLDYVQGNPSYFSHSYTADRGLELSLYAPGNELSRMLSKFKL